MIDEHRQDLAAEYALGSLDPESARAFEAILAADPVLKDLADNLRETAAALAHTAPSQLPPPELREKVLARIRGELQSSTSETIPAVAPAPPAKPTETPAPTGGGSLIPWAIAAGLAITTAATWMERDQLRKETVELRKDLQAARQRDEFSKIRIATLTSQVDAYSKATAAIVWDAEKQRGIIKLANLPPAASGKDYQLWVIDPKYPNPVNGGVVPVGADGIARVVFKPDQPIKKADKFAISVEPEGGVPKATGPIVFLGD